jgi:galactokinase
MDLAYGGERRTGSQCGRMDQVCAYGRQVTLLAFDGDRMEVTRLRPRRDVHLLVVDLQASKDTRRILADLHRVMVHGREPVRGALRAALGERNAEIVRAAQEALVCGDGRQLGHLMNAAQSLFDRAVAPACPAELAAPRLHAVLAHPGARELAYGGKGVGSQGDGCAQFVCRGPDERARLARLLESACGVRCLSVNIHGAVGPREDCGAAG